MDNRFQTFLFVFLLLLSGCATYQTAHNVKLVSFSNDISQGKSAGPIRGEDCTWEVFGNALGGLPTVERAFINAMNQAGALESAGFNISKSDRGEKIRYVNNVSTKREGFSAFIFGKNCIVVSGIGYR